MRKTRGMDNIAAQAAWACVLTECRHMGLEPVYKALCEASGKHGRDSEHTLSLALQLGMLSRGHKGLTPLSTALGMFCLVQARWGELHVLHGRGGNDCPKRL